MYHFIKISFSFLLSLYYCAVLPMLPAMHGHILPGEGDYTLEVRNTEGQSQGAPLHTPTCELCIRAYTGVADIPTSVLHDPLLTFESLISCVTAGEYHFFRALHQHERAPPSSTV